MENCHVAIISKEDFESVDTMRKGKACASAERKHEMHCFIGKIICGNCGHRLAHTYSCCPKYYRAKHYLDKPDGKCNINVLDETMEQSKTYEQELVDAFMEEIIVQVKDSGVGI